MARGPKRNHETFEKLGFLLRFTAKCLTTYDLDMGQQGKTGDKKRKIKDCQGLITVRKEFL